MHIILLCIKDSSMDKNIINSLIICKQDFDKKFEFFAFKQDLEAVFDHEHKHYVLPICEKIVPLLYKNLKENPDLNINNYYPYIVSKYHHIVKKEIYDYEKNSLNMVKNIGKSIIKTFLEELMKNSKETEDNKIAFITIFFNKSAHLFSLLIKSEPLYALTICAQLRNSRLQNLVLANFSVLLKKFIEEKSTESFAEQILPLFVYPRDISVKDYYKKWVSKEAIHVKFSKEVLGHHYQFAKQTLKENERINKNIKNNC